MPNAHMPTQTDPAPSQSELRAALSQFATGVTIVTTLDGAGSPVGLTVNSFASVSLDPPLVLWSLAHTSHTLEAFRTCSHYAIHVLAGAQRELAQRFAARGVDRFAQQPYRTGWAGVPLLPDTLATFECRNHRMHPEGDHTIFVGEVLRCAHSPREAALLYHRSMLRPDTLAAQEPA